VVAKTPVVPLRILSNRILSGQQRLSPVQQIRSFIGIPIPASLQKSAAKLVRRLSGERDGIKWVPIDNLHLTLKFLGDVDNREVPKVCEAVRECCLPVGPFDLQLQGAGAFPDASRPRVVYANVVTGGESLTAIVSGLEVTLAKLGFKPEPRDYIPHLTLGRARGGSRKGSPELAERIEANQSFDLGATEVEKVVIVASFLDKAGPTYQIMDTIQL
jgi:RNA 2',3'-cyclic 3'-phosphodiesterase